MAIGSGVHLWHELNDKTALQNIHSCCRMLVLAPGGCWRFLICGCASLLESYDYALANQRPHLSGEALSSFHRR